MDSQGPRGAATPGWAIAALALCTPGLLGSLAAEATSSAIALPEILALPCALFSILAVLVGRFAGVPCALLGVVLGVRAAFRNRSFGDFALVLLIGVISLVGGIKAWLVALHIDLP
jgi:hypothetical protein